MKKTLLTLCAAALAATVFAQDIKLPPPDKTGGKSIMQCLAERKTGRSFNPSAKLTDKQLSNLLYAACGYNRAEKRTIPTARNFQDLLLYVALPSGTYLYDAKANMLKMVVPGDHREVFGKQKSMFKSASAVLIYVSDFAKMKRADNPAVYAAAHTGSAYQDVYLVCASENLATVICGLIDREKIASFLKLKRDCKVQFTQPVGVPK